MEEIKKQNSNNFHLVGFNHLGLVLVAIALLLGVTWIKQPKFFYFYKLAAQNSSSQDLGFFDPSKMILELSPNLENVNIPGVLVQATPENNKAGFYETMASAGSEITSSNFQEPLFENYNANDLAYFSSESQSENNATIDAEVLSVCIKALAQGPIQNESLAQIAVSYKNQDMSAEKICQTFSAPSFVFLNGVDVAFKAMGINLKFSEKNNSFAQKYLTNIGVIVGANLVFAGEAQNKSSIKLSKAGYKLSGEEKSELWSLGATTPTFQGSVAGAFTQNPALDIRGPSKISIRGE